MSTAGSSKEVRGIQFDLYYNPNEIKFIDASTLLNGFTFEEKLQEIEKNTRNLFNSTIEAFKNQDIELARKVMKDYKKGISKQCDEITNTIISDKANIEANSAAAIALYARYLKRIIAHSRNLISNCYYNKFSLLSNTKKIQRFEN